MNPAINPNGEKEKASYYPNDWAWYDRYGSSFNYPNRGVIGSVIVGTEASTSGQNTVVIGRKAFNEFYSDTSNFNETNKLPQNISDNNVVVGHAAGFIIPGNLNGLKKDRDSDDANKIVELTGNSVAMGSKTWSTVKAVGIGNTARAMEAYSIALGNKAQVNSGAASGIALGDEASVSRGSVSSIALGTSAIVGLTANEANAGGGVDIQNGIAIGTGSNVKANSALALGHNAHGYGVQSIAIGEGSGVNALGAIAIGLNSNAEYQNSIALGSDSRAIKSEGAGLNYSNNLQFANNPLNWSATNGATLSVGNDKLSRRIMYVAAGSSATDAVNVAQLDGLAKNKIYLSDGSHSTKGHYLGNFDKQTDEERIKFIIQGQNSNIISKVVEGTNTLKLGLASDLTGVNSITGAADSAQLTFGSELTLNNKRLTGIAAPSVESDAVNLSYLKSYTADLGWTLQAGQNHTVVKPNNTVLLKADNNATVSLSGNTVTFGVSQSPTFTGKVSAHGFDAQGQTITNVANGHDNSDVANVGTVNQLINDRLNDFSTNLAYTANGGEKKEVSLKNGLNLVSTSQDLLTITANDNGEIDFGLNAATQSSDFDGAANKVATTNSVKSFVENQLNGFSRDITYTTSSGKEKVALDTGLTFKSTDKTPLAITSDNQGNITFALPVATAIDDTNANNLVTASVAKDYVSQ